ncbi:hypothetical protein GON09_002862 [Rhodococcus sp. B50]|nr:hypothetical protein [Rhodococcus sp. B50]
MKNRARFVDVRGRPALHFEREYPYPQERLWSAVTEPAELARWFPAAVDLELREGGTITFTDDPAAEPTTGTVLACEPRGSLAYTWEGDELWFTLNPTSQGCLFVFVNVLGDRETAAMVAAGWTVCLDEFDALLAGAPPSQKTDPETAWRPVYESYIAEGFPAGAPVPGQGGAAS